MAGFYIQTTITHSLELGKDVQRRKARAAILKSTAEQYQRRAQQLSTRPRGFNAVGWRTGDLMDSIKVSGLEETANPKRTRVRVYLDLSVAPYATFQEAGTGLYGEAGGSAKHWIKARGGAWMHWQQGGTPYRGRYVIASPHGGYMNVVRRKTPIKAKGGGLIRSRRQWVTTDWDQYALMVRGVRPKWFMRDAAKTRSIEEDFQRRVAETAKDTVRVKRR